MIGSIPGKEVDPPNRKLATSTLSKFKHLNFNQESAGSPVKHLMTVSTAAKNRESSLEHYRKGDMNDLI